MSSYIYLGMIGFSFMMFYWILRGPLHGKHKKIVAHREKGTLKIQSTYFLSMTVGWAVIVTMKILVEWQLFGFPIYLLIFCLIAIWTLATLWWFFSGFEKDWARQNPEKSREE